VEYVTAEAAARAVAYGDPGPWHLDGHVLNVEGSSRRAGKSRRMPGRPNAPPHPTSAAAAEAAVPAAARHDAWAERATASVPVTVPGALGRAQARTLSLTPLDATATSATTTSVPEAEAEERPVAPPTTALGDGGQVLRTDRVRASVRWDMVLEWEDVDEETVVPDPAREARVYSSLRLPAPVPAPVPVPGRVHSPVSEGVPVPEEMEEKEATPPAPPRVTVAGQLPPDHAPIDSVRVHTQREREIQTRPYGGTG
jgi:hypothetical protein